MTVKAANRSAAVVAEVAVLNWSASRLYHDDGPPWFDMDSDFRAIEKSDWTALRLDTETHFAGLQTDFFFEDGASTTAHGYFAIVPSADEVGLQITIKSRASGKEVMRRRLAVSPVDP
ncbi:hypothetical protein [uncultured Brevundimonas sp.]|uniref:hypothetical protein n=1 Tax=uncultured Brevundimonas sp. TaxID=213418 RepID=UPI0026006FC6|nr:hypothetical protein [uncultured Brevundimonas sp.]